MHILSELNSHSSIVERALRIKEHMSLEVAATHTSTISPLERSQQEDSVESPGRFERRDDTSLNWSKVDTSSDDAARIMHSCTIRP